MATDNFDLFADPRPPQGPVVDEKRTLAVSELNDKAAAMLEERFSQVLVEGEISGFLAHRSGHWYFTLKDERAQVQACCFKGSQRGIQMRPKDGDHVIVRGKLTVYGARGSYQFVVEHIKSAGAGALLEQLEALKQRLGAEGLFAAERKRPLPPIVRTVGLVTSPDGAALRDYLRVAHERDPGLRVIVFPTEVQGPRSAPQVAKTIALASARAKDLGMDVIVVTRGGGSIEDLWAFNDEQVVRAIAATCVPCVSAIGHEVDITLADHTADVRAPTPTAAAQLTSADMAAVRALFTRKERELTRAMRAQLDKRRVRLHKARTQDPRRHLARLRQDFDVLSQDLERVLKEQLKDAHHRLQKSALALQTHHPRRRLAQKRAQLDTLQLRLHRAQGTVSAARKGRLARLAAKLHALSPLAVLGRGYALVQKDSGEVVRTARDVAAFDRVRIRLGEGVLAATITGEKIDE